MKGGQHRYTGSGRGARVYIEADHHRADDYYLTEGEGIAQVVRVHADGSERDRLNLSGDDYEAWVEGVDVFDPARPDKGVLRHDAKALRFVEVVVNGPKSWSLAAGIHQDVSAALDAAQERAVTAIGGYVAQHVTTRVGGRGRQVQVPVDGIEMAQIRHYTTRAGDPHRHIHLQVNGRVFARGKWRGIDSRAMSQMQRAINGIGHRAVMADPEFRAALALHGYTLNADGEIEQLAPVVSAMSKRAAQVAANVERYEREWRAENPNQEPGRDLLRAWDTQAWKDGREAKKNHPTQALECEEGWLSELRALGIDVDALRFAAPTGTGAIPVGAVDREEVAERVLRVLGTGHNGRSAWNVWDVRGAVEETLAKRFVVGGPAEFGELAEDVADRVLQRSISLLDGPVPEHVRCFTSEEVMALEADIKGRLAARSTVEHVPAPVESVARALALAEVRGEQRVLDEGQVAAARAIAGSGALVVVEGAAGAGKTATLGTAKDMIEANGGRLRVVAPTKKAAIVAAAEIGAGEATEAQTAHGLAYQHGFRWDSDGVWSRLQRGDVDPVTGKEYRGPRVGALLGPRDVLVLDEAGMCDQETFRALVHIADETRAKLVPVGDRQQLPAVGRGGVMEMAVEWAPVHIELSGVHRFRTTDGQRDREFADLSLRIRAGLDPERVFDDLVAGGHVELWASEQEQLEHVAAAAAQRYTDGQPEALSLARNEDVDTVNSAVRQQLVTAGVVDDSRTVHGADGLPIGVGDQVMTRLNDADKDVANRQTWTVRAVTDDGELRVQELGRRTALVSLAAEYVQDHVQLAYASTIYGVQGDTRQHGSLVLSEATDAPGLYVGLTRGRQTNTVHIEAESMDEARAKWVEAAGRNRADLGLEQALTAARTEAANYGPVQQLTFAEKLAKLLERTEALKTAAEAQQQPERLRPATGYREGPHEAPRQHGPRL